MDNADNLSNAVEDYNGFLVKVLSGSKDSKDILQYVAGLKIGSEDYTAKVVIGVKEGKKII